MSGITVRVNSQAIAQYLSSILERGQHMKPAFDQIGEYLIRETQLRFDRQESPDGNPWAPLKPRTVKAKNRQNKISKILQARGDLRRSIVYQSSNTSLVIGSNRDYAAIHQFGGEIALAARSRAVNFRVNKRTGQSRFARKERGNFQQDVNFRASRIIIPARPYLGVNAQDEAEIIRILSTYLT